ncbi:MAG TPA: type I-E CRISPR-associated protein Cas6/Cse3/CasE [Anaerolineae bacterium]|nr:type I-E CRISPR-associated protein Cas6/Cse3/CasE [Anaerolineae bacterium]
MYLSRLFLNPRSRQVQSEIARPYQMHKTLLRAFPTPVPPNERVLFRLEIHPRTGQPMVLVQSQTSPDWGFLEHADQGRYLLPEWELPPGIPENPQVKAVDLRFRRGQRLAFRLFANPTKKIKVEGRKNGQRVELYREEDQRCWLDRKLQAAGARLIEVRISRGRKFIDFQRREDQGHRLTFYGVRFDGLLVVEDPEALLQAVQRGIGSGKGVGFGLLSLAPA